MRELHVCVACCWRWSTVSSAPCCSFLFTDYNRLSSVGGETSLAEMIATLSDACEREFGFLATRLFRVFKTEETQGRISFLLYVEGWRMAECSVYFHESMSRGSM